MRKFFTTFLFLTVILLVKAQDFTVDFLSYKVIDVSQKTVEVTGIEHDESLYGVAAVPATVTYEGMEYTVTGLADGAFYMEVWIKSVTLPETLLKIGSNALAYTAVDEIDIPEGVEYIGEYAFEGTKITGITIPSKIENLSIGLFLDCYYLKDVNLPDGLKAIGDVAFGHCFDLAGIAIPHGVTTIGYGAFAHCESLASITIPESVTSIDLCVFDGCSGLTSIVIPDSVTRIDNDAFRNCDGLTSVYYTGTEEEWEEIWISPFNSGLDYATRYYYSATQPTGSGNYWHYDTDGVTPVVW